MKRPDTTEYYPSEAGKEWQEYAELLEEELKNLEKDYYELDTKKATCCYENELMVERLEAEVSRLRKACSKTNDEICQILGKALWFPWCMDDQENFPGATVEDGVCVGEHVAESMADLASKKIRDSEEEIGRLELALEEALGCSN